MSFDIFLACFQEGENAPLPLTVLEAAFGSFAEKSDPECWTLLFPNGGSTELYLDDETEIDGFMVNDLPASPEFWNGLYAILSQTPSILYWPGEGDCTVIADLSVLAQIPADMIETLGTPFLVKGPDEIVARIEAG